MKNLPATGKNMTLREIREFLNVPRKTLEDCVARRFPGRMQNGKTTYLSEEEVAVISAELKRAHNTDLASTRQVAMTKIEKRELVRRALSIMDEEIAELRAELEIVRPKAIAHDEIADSSGSFALSDTAKKLGWGPKRFCEQLRNDHVLFYRKQGGAMVNIPYQDYIDRGWFAVKTIKLEPLRQQTRVTGRGELELSKRYSSKTVINRTMEGVNLGS